MSLEIEGDGAELEIHPLVKKLQQLSAVFGTLGNACNEQAQNEVMGTDSYCLGRAHAYEHAFTQINALLLETTWVAPVVKLAPVTEINGGGDVR